MGGKSNILKGLTSKAIPLGAISLENKKKIGNKRLNYLMNKSQKTSLTLLIRSSREHRKGCDLFLNALKILHDKFPKLRQHLRVISIGDNFINLANIDRFVNHQYKGYVDRKTLMCIYSEVDALLVTSREDAGPIMINESIALGVFVISTPVGVSEDLIVTNHNGIVTEDISAEAISEALFLLLQMYAEETWKQHAVQLVKKDKMQLTFEGYIESLVTLI
ncbi:hypothetical protein GCM10007966_08300 [Legionella impletisoli]|uniref:Glycosyl transferase family 1 domain-containing protein n=2 Tax=Legionella impletisoli TaxID=343510 RepID=A0A917JUI8_9GAMM|nr:hypothetical protein GCM10007966_08300 [Legionella impletisoli]